MNSFENYLMKQHMTAAFSNALVKMAVKATGPEGPGQFTMGQKAPKGWADAADKARYTASKASGTALVAPDRPRIAGLSTKGKVGIVALLAALGYGGSKVLRRASPKASAKARLTAMLKKHPKKAIGGGVSLGALAALAASR